MLPGDVEYPFQTTDTPDPHRVQQVDTVQACRKAASKARVQRRGLGMEARGCHATVLITDAAQAAGLHSDTLGPV